MKERERLFVAVASHKPYRMPSDSCYHPLLVGAALHPAPSGSEKWFRDDDGDSISDRNAFYSELTGMWWLWKNVDVRFKGLVHYRRHFASPDFARRCLSRDRFKRIASERELLAALSSSPDGVLLPCKRNYVIESVGSHYRHTLPGEQLDVALEVVYDKAPSYASAFETVLTGRQVHLFNMALMRSDVFDAYCSWLFPILFELERRLDPAVYDSFNARYPGRISERLMDAWIATEGIRFSELPTMSPEPVNWARKGSSFLAARFFGKKYEGSF